MVQLLFGEEEWYIYYMHKGDGTGKTKARHGEHSNKEHIHVWLPGRDRAQRETLRTAIKRATNIGGGDLSIVDWEGGVLTGISYGSHEGTLPVTKGDVEQWITDAPAWISPEEFLNRKRKRRTVVLDDGEVEYQKPRVTPYSLEVVSVHHYKKYKTVIDAEGRCKYFATLQHMIKSGKYQFLGFGDHKGDRYQVLQFYCNIEEPGAQDAMHEHLYGRHYDWDVPFERAPTTPQSWGEEDPEA